MSDYPFWWDKTITIYNRIQDTTTSKVTWSSCVLTECFWQYRNNVNYVNNVKMEVKDVICRIPKKENYTPLETWKTLTEFDGLFTLRNGDVIILGEVSDEVDEYTRGKHMTDVLNKYKEVNRAIQIESFTDDTGVGLCAEHYKILGV